MRGNGLYRVVPLAALVVSLALSSCRVFDYEQREPWRAEAEEKCLAEKLVQPSAYMEPESSIEGRGAARISCRFTHVYPDGPAPYFTVLAPAVRGGEVAQWDEIKAAVSEALIAGGATITHHHAVGRDHRPWYDRQRPAPFAAALRAAKAELDPAGTLNPGVLLDP